MIVFNQKLFNETMIEMERGLNWEPGGFIYQCYGFYNRLKQNPKTFVLDGVDYMDAFDEWSRIKGVNACNI